MEIRDQMTATVRLTKQAAQRLNTFIGSLKTQPKNMNDALNLALSDLPIASFVDEITTLQEDPRKALIDINTRYRSTGVLKRSDYFFLILMAKEAAWLSKKERVRHQSIQTVLEIILELWELCKHQDSEGHEERYLLSNLSGNSSDPQSQRLETHIPLYIEQSKSHPFPGTLEFALRDPEVLLRRDLAHVDDAILHEKLGRHFYILHGMAVRCLFLKTRQPLTLSENTGYFGPNFSDSFGIGSQKRLHLVHSHDKNFGFSFAFKNFVLAANNIVEAEEFIDAFTPLDKPDLTYKGEYFSLIHDSDGNGFIKGGFMFQTRMIQTWITREEYDEASQALADMLSDPRVSTALKETYERFGTI